MRVSRVLTFYAYAIKATPTRRRLGAGIVAPDAEATHRHTVLL